MEPNSLRENIRFLWLLPINKEEADYANTFGIELLEERFDNSDFEYWNEKRMSILAQ